MLGRDWLERDQWLALSLVVDRGHSELVLLALLQPRDVTLGRAAELAHRRPLPGRLVLLLHHVVANGLATIVLIRAKVIAKTLFLTMFRLKKRTVTVPKTQ